jgi:methyl coenzyme M reductase subunit C-like uncharacterized protein (methanogenesis marker protein 7)
MDKIIDDINKLLGEKAPQMKDDPSVVKATKAKKDAIEALYQFTNLLLETPRGSRSQRDISRAIQIISDINIY